MVWKDFDDWLGIQLLLSLMQWVKAFLLGYWKRLQLKNSLQNRLDGCCNCDWVNTDNSNESGLAWEKGLHQILLSPHLKTKDLAIGWAKEYQQYF